MTRNLPFLTAALAMGVAIAPANAQVLLNPDDVQAGAYAIDSKETLVRYGTIHMGINEFWGTFPNAKGTLVLDPKSIGDAKLDVSVPVATVSTTNKDLDTQLRSSAFFDAAKYPNMRFVSTSVTRTGPTTAKISGDLTLHGVTKPIVLDATFTGAGPNSFSEVFTIGFKAQGVINRSDFGIGKWIPVISDVTTINISAAFEKKK
ncbi:YceI family protein [Caulobacter sp.]|uniref:YceI family protein n=1 Tax=Caulobacter sp. TaxID=78 RepID=UPI003BA88273